MSPMPPLTSGYNQQPHAPFNINMPPQLPIRQPPLMKGFPSMFPNGNFVVLKMTLIFHNI
jgi:hypothetical protein